MSDYGMLLEQMTHPSSTSNDQGVLPPSAAYGWAITSNYDGGGTVEFWNTANAGQGFNFRQKTGDASQFSFAWIGSDGIYSELDFYDSAGTLRAIFGEQFTANGAQLAGVYIVSNAGLPIAFYPNFVLGAGTVAPTVTMPSAGGIVVGAPTGGSKGAGTVNAVQVYANNVLLTSDAALKRDVEALPDCLALVMAIEPKSYRLDAPDPADRRNWGFIAQDVAAKMAAAGCDFGGVVEDEGGHSLSYADMIAVLWKAVQELAAERKRR